jgi:hypothetical protein
LHDKGTGYSEEIDNAYNILVDWQAITRIHVMPRTLTSHSNSAPG